MKRTPTERKTFERSNAWLQRARRKYFYVVWREMFLAVSDSERETLLYNSIEVMRVAGLYSFDYCDTLGPAWSLLRRCAVLDGFSFSDSQWLNATGWYHRYDKTHYQAIDFESRKFEKKVGVA